MDLLVAFKFDDWYQIPLMPVTWLYDKHVEKWIGQHFIWFSNRSETIQRFFNGDHYFIFWTTSSISFFLSFLLFQAISLSPLTSFSPLALPSKLWMPLFVAFAFSGSVAAKTSSDIYRFRISTKSKSQVGKFSRFWKLCINLGRPLLCKFPPGASSSNFTPWWSQFK